MAARLQCVRRFLPVTDIYRTLGQQEHIIKGAGNARFRASLAGKATPHHFQLYNCGLQYSIVHHSLQCLGHDRLSWCAETDELQRCTCVPFSRYRAMLSSDGAHRPRSKRTQAQQQQQQHMSFATQAQGPPPRRLGMPPYEGTSSPLTQCGHCHEVLYHWVPVLPLLPGAALPRASEEAGSEVLGYTARRGRTEPNSQRTPSELLSSVAGAHKNVPPLQMGILCNVTTPALPTRSGAPLRPTTACGWLPSDSNSDPELSIYREANGASEHSESSDTLYADASSVCYQSEATTAQTAAQAAAQIALKPVQTVMTRLQLAENLRSRHSPQATRQRHRRVRSPRVAPECERDTETIAHVNQEQGSNGMPPPGYLMVEAACSDIRSVTEVPPSQWEWMVEGVMRNIINALDPVSVQRIRQVCRQWKGVVGRNLAHLQPAANKLYRFVDMFPSLVSIDLSGCSNVRNCDLLLLAQSKLNLRALVLGRNTMLTHSRPRITNVGLAAIAELTTLTRLSLSDCSAITGNGMTALSALTRLRVLCVTRCRRVTDLSMVPLMALPHLAYLDFFGSSKIGDGMLLALVDASAQARRCLVLELHLGLTCISTVGIITLACLTHLKTFTCEGELISEGASQALSALTGLHHLGLSNTTLCGDALLALLRCLPVLQRLDLRNSLLADEHLVALAQAAPALTRLDVPGLEVMGTNGLASLRKLRGLRSLCLDAQSVSEWPTFFSGLTSLTRLKVERISAGLGVLPSICELPKLQHLTLSDFNGPHSLFPGQPPLLEALVQLSLCSCLVELELLYTGISSNQVYRMVAGLPSLRRLRVHDCPITVLELLTLTEQHPLLRILRMAPYRID